MNDDLYDQDYDLWTEAGLETRAQRERALINEQLLMWEHELSQSNYYDYFLDEVTR